MQSPSANSFFAFTKLSKAIALVIAAGYLFSVFFPHPAHTLLALQPAKFIPCVWNVFTAGLLELNLVKAIFSIASILVLAKLIEPLWGSKEFLQFLAAVNAATGMATLLSIVLLYACLQYREHAGDLLYTPVAGFEGLTAACLVALKHAMPDNEVTLLQQLKFRAKVLPSVYVVGSVVLACLFGSPLSTVPSVLFGTYFAWVYLRFFQLKAESGVRGDRWNEAFSLGHFFPSFLQPGVDRVSEVVGGLLGIGRPVTPEGVLAAGTPGAAAGGFAGDSARRRERGARVLEEKLGASAPEQHQGALKSPPPVVTRVQVDAGKAGEGDDLV